MRAHTGRLAGSRSSITDRGARPDRGPLRAAHEFNGKRARAAAVCLRHATGHDLKSFGQFEPGEMGPEAVVHATADTAYVLQLLGRRLASMTERGPTPTRNTQRRPVSNHEPCSRFACRQRELGVEIATFTARSTQGAERTTDSAGDRASVAHVRSLRRGHQCRNPAAASVSGLPAADIR